MKKSNTPLSYALFLLGRRDYATTEIAEKLKKKYNQEETDNCLKILIEKKLLDDDRFVRSYIRNHASKGKLYLKQKLNQYKIKTEIIEKNLDQITSEDEIEKAEELAEKYYKRKSGQQNLYQKMGGLLSRRGFSYEIVKIVLENILKNQK